MKCTIRYAYTLRVHRSPAFHPARVIRRGRASGRVAGVCRPPGAGGCTSNESAIRPFTVQIPEEDLADLRRRIAATRWPESETVEDASQGVQLATMRALARYWGNDYDMGRVQARLNAFPQFMTEIDGLD